MPLKKEDTKPVLSTRGHKRFTPIPNFAKYEKQRHVQNCESVSVIHINA